MVSQILSSLLTASGPVVYVTVALLAFGESAALVGLVLPGETALLVGGVLAGRGGVGLGQLLLVAAAAAILGDTVGYRTGRAFGPPLRRSRMGRLIGEPRWVRAESYLHRRGGPAIFWCRWVGVLRALVPTVAGMGRMPYRTFLPWNIAGGLSWVGTIVGLGYLFSGSLDALLRALASVGAVMTALAVAAIALAVARRLDLLGRIRAGAPVSIRDRLRGVASRAGAGAGVKVLAFGASLRAGAGRDARWVGSVGLVALLGGFGAALAT